jgi:hypothetical protein
VTETTFTTFPKSKPLKLPRKLKVIIAIMLVCAFLGVVSLGTKSNVPSTKAGLTYVGFATLVIDNYVAGHVLDVPLASGLSSTLGRESAVGSGASQSIVTGKASSSTAIQPLPVQAFSFLSGTDKNVSKTLTIETDTFLLEYTNGSLSDLDIVVYGTPSGPELAALPALLPASKGPGALTEAGAPIPVESLNQPLSAGLQTRVNQWAKAYVSNSQVALYQATGDTQNVTFHGLGGFNLIGDPVITMATQDGPRIPTTMVLTVEMTLQSTSDNNVIEQVSYDLLVTGLSNQYPNIVAWGPPGSGSSLTPYENAS